MRVVGVVTKAGEAESKACGGGRRLHMGNTVFIIRIILLCSHSMERIHPRT